MIKHEPTSNIEAAARVLMSLSATPDDRVAAKAVIVAALVEVVRASKRPMTATAIRRTLKAQGAILPATTIRSLAFRAVSLGLLTSPSTVGISYVEASFAVPKATVPPIGAKGIASTFYGERPGTLIKYDPTDRVLPYRVQFNERVDGCRTLWCSSFTPDPEQQQS
jgi:hypothetical protein